MEVTCTFCGQAFTVPPTMAGGIANCPDCQRAVEVPGRSEAMYWALLGLGGLGVLAAAGIGFALGGPVIGGTVLAAGAIAGIVLLVVVQ